VRESSFPAKTIVRVLSISSKSPLSSRYYRDETESKRQDKVEKLEYVLVSNVHYPPTIHRCSDTVGLENGIKGGVKK
jgi:hypothetical protein